MSAVGRVQADRAAGAGTSDDWRRRSSRGGGGRDGPGLPGRQSPSAAALQAEFRAENLCGRDDRVTGECVQSAVRRRGGETKSAEDKTRSAQGLSSRTNDDGHDVRAREVNLAVSVLAEDLEASAAELRDEVAPEQTRRCRWGVVRTELREALVLAPLPLSRRAHEFDTVILGIAQLRRGEGDRGAVRVGGDGGNGLVEDTPALDEHEVRPARVAG